MCGIAGIVDFQRVDIDRRKVEAMTDGVAHRGPDAAGFHFEEHVGLGHRRLSIIDPEGGVQPMSIDDDACWIVYNGEVYNFAEIRDELEKRGRRFATRSDTEVLVRAYREWGTDCLYRFNGMFAFAIWDRGEKTLFLARDRVGIKPLVYNIRGGRMCFASEARALAVSSDETPALDEFGLVAYFLLQYVPGEATILKNIRRLEPGEAATFSPQGFKKWKWWRPSGSGDVRSGVTSEGELLDLLDDSVKKRLIADVPLGAFLSGGVDSSVVVGLMSRHAGERVRTYQVAFEDPPGYDETPYAVMTSRKFDTIHSRTVMSPGDLSRLLPAITSRMGEPVADPAIIPTYIISGHARREVAVVLTGEGGDELFAGYLRYRLAMFSQAWKMLPNFLRRLGGKVAGAFPNAERWRKAMDAMGASNAAAHLAWVRVLDPADLQLLLPDMDVAGAVREILERFGRYFDGSSGRSLLRGALDCDLETWLPCDLLAKVDSASMAHGLEARVPMLDHRMVKWARGLDDRQLINLREGKLIFKKAAKDLVPPKVFDRGKRGFTLPLDEWFRGPLRGFLVDSIEGLPTDLGVDAAVARSWIGEELDGRRNHSLRLFALITLSNWWKRLA